MRALDALVKKHWGSIQGGTPEERLAEMRRINNDLRAGQGRLAPARHCSRSTAALAIGCTARGTRSGPELTHANRQNTDELLATIVNPSAVVRKEFMSFLVQTTEGRVLTGLLVEQTPGSVTLLDAKNERTTVARDKIEAIQRVARVADAREFLSTLKPQELRDLFAYLQSDSRQSAAKE